MEQDPLEQLDSNIKSLIDRLSKVEKDSDEYKQGIHDLQSKAGRMKASAAPGQVSLADTIATALSEKAGEIKNVGTNAGLKFETKAAAADMTSYPSGASISVGQYNPFIQGPPNRPYHVRELFKTNVLNTLNLAFLKETSLDGGTSPTK